jgi:hypothetical protein
MRENSERASDCEEQRGESEWQGGGVDDVDSTARYAIQAYHCVGFNVFCHDAVKLKPVWPESDTEFRDTPLKHWLLDLTSADHKTQREDQKAW